MGAKKEGKKKRNTMTMQNASGYWDGGWRKRFIIKKRVRKKLFKRKYFERNVA